MYGAQATIQKRVLAHWFENDVEMYGAQAERVFFTPRFVFENDVEMYGAQATLSVHMPD